MTDQNLDWLFWAYGAGWALIFGYIIWVSQRERELGRKLEQLRGLLEKRQVEGK